jgi:hypothetical protein
MPTGAPVHGAPGSTAPRRRLWTEVAEWEEPRHSGPCWRHISPLAPTLQHISPQGSPEAFLEAHSALALANRRPAPTRGRADAANAFMQSHPPGGISRAATSPGRRRSAGRPRVEPERPEHPAGRTTLPRPSAAEAARTHGALGVIFPSSAPKVRAAGGHVCGVCTTVVKKHARARPMGTRSGCARRAGRRGELPVGSTQGLVRPAGPKRRVVPALLTGRRSPRAPRAHRGGGGQPPKTPAAPPAVEGPGTSAAPGDIARVEDGPVRVVGTSSMLATSGRCRRGAPCDLPCEECGELRRDTMSRKSPDPQLETRRTPGGRHWNGIEIAHLGQRARRPRRRPRESTDSGPSFRADSTVRRRTRRWRCPGLRHTRRRPRAAAVRRRRRRPRRRCRAAP